MTILPNLSDLVIEQVCITNDVTVTVRAASPTALCPCCGTLSNEFKAATHARYAIFQRVDAQSI